MRRFTKLILLFLFLNVFNSFGHSGGTDANGGHRNHKTGKYHYHNGSKSSGTLWPILIGVVIIFFILKLGDKKK